ncbi:MAG: DUF2442 domain-containing protein [Chitinophagales bacterium]|nr:DUF2442 domain-containing protein [Chitinophagales bacterium]
MNKSVISIVNAHYLNNYSIQSEFSDGKKQTLNFFPFISETKNPMTRKYLDKKKFQSFHSEHGDLLWGDYEMCFPVWDLYEGKI